MGLAGSANIGEECAMFEAIHGSAPLIAGKNVANPSGLLQGAVMMLNHIGQTDIATKVHNAWLKTLEDGIHTADIFTEGLSTQQVGTKAFADAVIANLGLAPSTLHPVSFAKSGSLQLPPYQRRKPADKQLVGVDVFVHWPGTDPVELAEKLKRIELDAGRLAIITNRGIKVWPDGFKETFCTDHWRCRFMPKDGFRLHKEDILTLLSNALHENLDTIKTENLYTFDGKAAYSLGQGQ